MGSLFLFMLVKKVFLRSLICVSLTQIIPGNLTKDKLVTVSNLVTDQRNWAETSGIVSKVALRNVLSGDNQFRHFWM